MSDLRDRGALRPDGSLDPDAYAHLLEQRDFLLRSLDDLEREREAGDIDDHDYEVLRDDYTGRAAQVLRAIEAGRAVLDAPRPRRGARTLAAGVAVAALALVAGVAVAQSSGTRLPGETLTGDIRPTTFQQLDRAAALVAAGEAVEAIRIYDEVLAVDPDNNEALRNRGWILVQAGLLDEGLASIERALELEPRNPDALFFRARALQLRGDVEEAAATYRRFLATPGLAGDARDVAEQLLAELEGAGASGAAGEG